MPNRDYYLILGVGRDARLEGIREAYRELALRYHPDRAGAGATALFQDIVEAYHVLSDPERRASYDAGLRHADRPRAGAAPRSAVVPAPPPTRAGPLVPGPVPRVRDFLAFGPSTEALLAALFGAARAPAPRPIEVDLLLSPGQAAQGGLATFPVPVPFPCERCRGEGRTLAGRCASCAGRGILEEERHYRLAVPSRVPDGAVFEAPLRGLGVRNLYLKVVVRVRG